MRVAVATSPRVAIVGDDKRVCMLFSARSQRVVPRATPNPIAPFRGSVKVGQIRQVRHWLGGTARSRICPPCDAEIARLQSENATLKREMIAHAVPLPGGLRADPGSRPQVELRLPSEADVDRLMTFMERIWRRLIDMVQNVQKDIDKKG